ncbi:MAG TPA: hypothetical protein VGS79_22555 [Puia sp.]|nr:hypothetical protein [Puia sp.]
MTISSFFRRLPGRGAARYLYIAIPVMMVEWIVFKSYYPFADFFTDSYSYIEAAVQQDAIGYRPIGYSLFLRLVNAVWTSDTFLVTVQYLLVQGACLGLFLTLVRRCELGPRASGVLLAFLLLNPTISYLCNYVSSDALFVGLSIIWLTVLMGMMRAPTWWRLALQVALLFIIFNVRYVALYYPAVASLSFLLLRKKASAAFKLTGIVCSIGAVVIGMSWIKRITYEHTGAGIFSAFSGWQIANNALHLYPFLPVDTVGLPSPATAELAADVRNFFALTGPELLKRGPVATTEYMWVRSSPLHIYMDTLRRREHTTYFNAWNRVGPVFTEYGYFLVRRHPLAYIRYYAWNSAKSFFVSPLDVFGVYNEGQRTVDMVAVRWFRYRGKRVRAWSFTGQEALLAPWPWIALYLNFVFVITTLWYLFSRKRREANLVFMGSLELTAAYLLSNALFCIAASPSVFRYQVLPIILLFFFTVASLGLLWERRPAENRPVENV